MNTQNNLKTKALLVLLLMAMGLAKAQNSLDREYEWDNLATENRVWVYLYWDGYSNDTIFYQYGIKGDTVINGMEYKNLFISTHIGYPFEGESVGGIRADGEGRFYFVNFYNGMGASWLCLDEVNVETLLYDFSLSIHDEWANPCSAYDEYPLAPAIVDDITEEIFNGITRRVLWFDNNESWIEGIGAKNGLLNPLEVTILDMSIHYLVEVFQDGESIYLRSGFENIDYTDIVKQQSKNSNITRHPNPTTGIVRIEGEKATEIQVLNALGQLVKTIQNTNEVNLHGLPQGIYLLRVALEDGTVFTDKVVKE